MPRSIRKGPFVDSHLANKVIEANKIFGIPYKQIEILTHPKSYVHAIVKFNNGMLKIVAHDTNMKIPIHNSLYPNNTKPLKTKNLDLNKLNNLELKSVNCKKFPLTKIINKFSNRNTLFETVIVSANDELVNLFLNNDIEFINISSKLNNFLSLKEFRKYKYLKPNKISKILNLNKYVRLKIQNICI